MGLFSFLSTKTKLKEQARPIFAERVTCDDSKTQDLADLFKMPANQRDEKWTRKIYQLIQTASLASGEPEVFKGPDGFPYYVLRVPEAGKSFEAQCVRNITADFLLDKGYGVAINPTDMSADWVLSHGDIVNFHLNNEFISDADYVSTDNIEMTKKLGIIKKGEQVMMAQPSERYLPKQTRAVLKKLLKSKGIRRPMIMLLCRKSDGNNLQQLVFNVHAENFTSPSDKDDLMQQICWHLPRHYTILSIPKSSHMTKNFDDL